MGREEDEENYEERIEQQLAKQEEEDLDKIKEESRKRRQVILEKYKQQQQKHGKSPSDNYPEGNLSSCYPTFFLLKRRCLCCFFLSFLSILCYYFYMFICSFSIFLLSHFELMHVFTAGDEESMHEDKLWEQDSKKSFGQALMGDSDVKQDSSDTYVADSLFTVAKSPILCGTVSPERNGGAEGLDEGTPEVCYQSLLIGFLPCRV